MIEELKEEYGIQELCQATGVSRSGYYAWRSATPSARDRENAEIVEKMNQIRARHKDRLGSPRMTKHLQMEGARCSENRVARLMRCNGIRARRKRPFRPKTTQPGKKPCKNLLAGTDLPKAPNRVWVGDITYVPTTEGFLYLSIVLDLYSRQIVGWKLEETMESWIVEESIRRAVRRRVPGSGLIFHSDRGVQYCSALVRETLAAIGAKQSMSGKGNCYDNAYAESFFSTLKAESFPSNLIFESKLEARLAIFEYIEGYYSLIRLHSSLGYMTPSQFELCNHNNWLQETESEANNVSANLEDRAMRGRNSSARLASNTVGSAAFCSLPANPPDGAQMRKIPGGLGDGVHQIQANKSH